MHSHYIVLLIKPFVFFVVFLKPKTMSTPLSTSSFSVLPVAFRLIQREPVHRLIMHDLPGLNQENYIVSTNKHLSFSLVFCVSIINRSRLVWSAPMQPILFTNCPFKWRVVQSFYCPIFWTNSVTRARSIFFVVVQFEVIWPRTK